MDEISINIYKRYSLASYVPNINSAIKKYEYGKITPSKCPAIYKAYNHGCYLLSVKNYTFDNDGFYINRYTHNDKLFLDPGIIGDPTSSRIFARIDTGYSFKNLKIDTLSIPVLEPNITQGIHIPPVIYPRGYTGPILAPIKSLKDLVIKEKDPLIHLMPFSINSNFVEINSEIKHPDFEGLFYDSIKEDLKFVDVIHSSKFFG